MNMVWIMVLILLAAIIMFAIVSRPQAGGKKRLHRGPSRGASVDRQFVSSKWATIQSMAAGNGSSLRDAVSEADKLLDYAMKNSGFRGATMGERLKFNGSRFSNINGIWSAHKVRNALAHEADFDLVASQAREAISEFERGLRDLGAL